MITLTVNGDNKKIEAEADTPLLWALRDHLHLTGTKFGCGIAMCGACTVHVDGKAVRSCTLPIASAVGKNITTIEGLAQDAGLNPVQQAWLEYDVAQCGYCQSGQIMAATALLAENAKPNDTEIDNAMGGLVCRCGTYQRIREAIHAAAISMAQETSS
ncbi:MAG: isoquinoline 1-oxidoreductase alpha subunit [Litorivivens sp.]|jgi:isoquinoline 1-oxidoreductase alpha subunit|tara:strand:- start:5525 stop:5998 length:474 start_codon:yes stop_codon:yes gene_type:complete